MKNFSEIKENDIFYHIKISNSQIMHGEKENPLMEVKVERIIKGTSVLRNILLVHYQPEHIFVEPFVGHDDTPFLTAIAAP